ncbi:MAG: 3-hydroxyacyl-CoA dehydrogenase family protein [Eubacteriales bacterium]|nr:3-hydroxyacyl-CoA dehydrogenase family protein [Eubacteriales bacterium]
MAVVGVIGSGTMGKGVAQHFAQYNHTVVLVDKSEDILANSIKHIEKSIRASRLFNQQTILEEPEVICSRIKTTTCLEDLSDTDFIVENISEDIDAKHNLYSKIDLICSEKCIFMVNTSCISITQISGFTKRAEKVLGTHFMNPVDKIHTVETIMGFHTTELTLEQVTKLLKSVGKRVVLVQDSVGFVSNRISHLMMNEAAFIVQDQVADAQAVDDIFRSCYGHKMGPLETADLIGLDTVVNSLRILYDSFQDAKFRCCPLLKKMVNAGLLGRKTGKGFYEY